MEPVPNNGENRTYQISNGSRDVDCEQNENFEGVSDGTVQPLVDWLNTLLPELNLPLNPSENELRACLIDGAVLCNILEKLSPGSVKMRGNSEPGLADGERFLTAMDELGLPHFVFTDIQQGYMEPFLQCLGTLKAHFDPNTRKDNTHGHLRRWNQPEVEFLGSDSHAIASTCGDCSTADAKDGEKNYIDSNNQLGLHFSDELDTNVLGLVKSNSFDSASTQKLFKLVNTLLDKSLEKKGHVHHMVPVLKKVVQVIEQRTSIQAENLKEQNHCYRDCVEKYQSRIRVLEALAVGTREEIKVLSLKLQQIMIEKTRKEEQKKLEEQNVLRLKEEKNLSECENLKLKGELELAKQTNEENCLQLKTQTEETVTELNKKLQQLECFLTKSRKKVKELESILESKSMGWKRKEGAYRSLIDHHFIALQDLRAASENIKHELLKAKSSYSNEVKFLGNKLKVLAEAAGNYHSVLAENRRLYNEVQDLRGNIRVYCRVRPFLPGQSGKQSTIEYIGENGELVVSNPSKKGKQSQRLFKFNKIFGPTASQEDVFLDTQPLIRSVLDGYSVCIFAYGQTGSGKTYTMSGPSISSEEDWGVNYRALHDLFRISQSRGSSISYEVGVQMVEIYNEQVRDLLSDTSSRKRLGIWNTTQPNGLAVPDASMYPVSSTADVLELMEIGLMNRAIGATALNERSSRSHSVLTVHVRGTDLETGGTLRGSLHLVDLAGSERVDRSEATGDRLKEAQHINKSLSALGDVIFALAQKSPHVPYRNSKLTQLLQGSLGGQAKALMFVQLNPDVDSYSETISTLKFAERVSGVELGAARSNKESRDIRELLDQVTSLKNIIAKKDEEIEQLQSFKGNLNLLKNHENSFSCSSSPRRHSFGMPLQSPRLSRRKSTGAHKKSASDNDKSSVHSKKKSEAGSIPSDDSRTCNQPLAQSKSMIDLRLHDEFLSEVKSVGVAVGPNSKEDIDLLGFGDADSEERLSDISDSVLSMGTETDISIASALEFTLFPQSATPADGTESSKVAKPAGIAKPIEAIKTVEKAENTQRRANSASKLPKPPQTLQQTRLSRLSLSKGPASAAKVTSSLSVPRKMAAGSLPATRPVKQWH